MKIAALVSGGVDSSVALKLLKDQGHDVTAFYLKIWLEDELSSLGDCPWQEDLRYIEELCAALKVPLQVISLQEEYHQRVVAATIAEVRVGNTPNPDIWCNQFIKFGIFYDCIDSSFEKVATGHYAQLAKHGGRLVLRRAPDPVKDQSYFLCNLSQAQLERAIFPIGHLTKPEVRALAATFDLPTKNRKDSQGICFLGKFKFSDFLQHHCGTQEGNLVEFETKKIVGTHSGHWFFTVGQRSGIQLSGGPWYVVAKNATANTVYISRNYEAIEHERSTFRVHNFNWLAEQPTKCKLLVKIRHRATPQPCTISFSEDGKTATVQLQQKDQGIAPGQFAVFYDGDLCLGSAVIE